MLTPEELLASAAGWVRREPRYNAWRWATVVYTAPLRIRLDGQTDPVAATPSSLVAGLTPGDRVWVQLAGRRVVVLGAHPASRPEVHLRLTGSQAVNGYEDIYWGTADVNIGNMWAYGTDVNIYRAGRYAVTATAQWGGDASTHASLFITLNGDVMFGQGQGNAPINNEGNQCLATMTRSLEVGDVIRAAAAASNPLDIQPSGAAGTRMDVTYIGP